MAEGSIFKRCTCRDETGRRFGPNCPQLHRAGGAWSPTHGRWGYQLELPPKTNGDRRQLRRATFDSRDTAANDRDHANALLALAGDDDALAIEIADLLQEVKPAAPLPDRDTIARRVRAGLPATADMTVGPYSGGVPSTWDLTWVKSNDQWLLRDITPKTVPGIDTNTLIGRLQSLKPFGK